MKQANNSEVKGLSKSVTGREGHADMKLSFTPSSKSTVDQTGKNLMILEDGNS